MIALPLALRLAARELRGGLKGFRVFITCLALGVGAIAAVGSLSQAVVAGLEAESGRLLGGDVELRLFAREPSAEENAWLNARSRARSDVVEMRAMAEAIGRSGRTLVELKAVDAPYPLIGAVALDPVLPLDQALARRDGVFGAVLAPSLLSRLDLKPGDRVRVGEAEFQVRADLALEPDEVASVFELGPRVMIAREALAATGLVQPGSQIQYKTRLLLPESTAYARWVAELEAAWPRAGWRVRGVDRAAPGTERFLERLTLFLTFAGLTALLVGGIGVANAVKSYLDRKTATIATFKCLGAPAQLVFRVYLAQILALAFIGIGIGLLAGAVLPLAAIAAVGDLLPVEPRAAIYPMPLLVGTGFGLLTALTFGLWPLVRARDVRAGALFRDQVAPIRAHPRRADVALVAVCALALAGLTVASASERGFALWFVGGASLTLLLLRLGAAGLMRLAARLPHGRAALRLALTNVHRPGATTPSVVLSLGTGLAVLVAIALIQGNLRRQIDERLPEEAPAFFFLDIQSDQAATFDRAITAVEGTRGYRRVPTLRGRIVAIKGVPVEKASIAPDSEWAVRGDRALTYAAAKPEDSRLVAGTWWPADYAGPPIVSLDAGIARGFGVGVGDTLTFNVLGRDIEARVVSLREIDWRSLRFDFAVIFAPGTIERAPHTNMAAIQADPEAERRVEQAADAFANVSVVRVREALEAASQILAGIGAAVGGTAAISLLAGAIVLGGAIAATRERRTYDAVVFKVIGATRGTVLRAFLLEYGVLGLATGVIAAAIGSATAWAVVVFLMEMPWTPLPATVAVTIAGCIVATLLAGFAGTWQAMGRKAAPYLRNK